MKYDDSFSFEEKRLMDTMKGKNRMEQDQIIFDYERKKNDGNTI